MKTVFDDLDCIDNIYEFLSLAFNYYWDVHQVPPYENKYCDIHRRIEDLKYQLELLGDDLDIVVERGLNVR